MRTPEETIKIIDEALKEATKYAEELSICTPGTEGYKSCEYWKDQKRNLISFKEVVEGTRNRLWWF